MIRDWKKISEISADTKTLVSLFHSTPMEVYLEKVYLFKYLLEKNEDAEKAWEIFKEIVCSTDLEKKLLDGEYKYYLKISKQKKWIDRPSISFFITESEIDHINNIQASKEFRDFVLGMVIYGKYTRQQIGVPLFGPRDRSYIYYLMNQKDDFNYGKNRYKFLNSLISRKDIGTDIRYYPASLDLNLRSRVLNIPKTVESFNGEWIEWDAKSGYLISDLEKDAYILKNKILEQTSICPLCNKEFYKSKKAKTCYCPECYKKERKKNIAKNVAKLRSKNKCNQETPEC